MEDQSLWYLENLDVSAMLCPSKTARQDQVRHTEKTFRKGDYIFVSDEQADKLFFIMEGRVKIGTHGGGGKEITKAILQKGEVFGELALMGREKRRDFAIALEQTVICVISTEQIKLLMKDRSGLSMFLLQIMGNRVLEMEQRLESLVFKDSRTRIIEFLHDLAENKGKRIGYEMLVRQFMTHQEIANLTATSRQTVTTVLNDLRNKNILTFNRRRLLVRDMDLLGREIG
ncbi:MAG: Crp/Fnr family transcriptional regulator [Saprospiraceae bacterium]